MRSTISTSCAPTWSNGALPDAKVEKAIQLFEDARDHIVGGFHRKDPLAWDYRTARALKNVGNLAVLGKAVYSQVSDLARFVGVQGLGAKRLVTGEGPAGLIGGLMSAFAGDISKYHPGGIAKLSGRGGRAGDRAPLGADDGQRCERAGDARQRDRALSSPAPRCPTSWST
jgi:hypothetical protein